jgi:hypothetical protein
VSAHTPGPWDARNTLVVGPVANGRGPRLVCDTDPDGDPDTEEQAADVANARLIAAAPELLAALVECSDWIWARMAEHDCVPPCLGRARKAIAKAEVAQA